VSATSPLRVAYIGLGSMGGAMATRLVTQGRDLVVHDLSPDVVDRLVAKGAVAANDAQLLRLTPTSCRSAYRLRHTWTPCSTRWATPCGPG